MQTMTRQEQWVVGASLLLVFALIALWGLLAPYPWDDDCVRRYFNVRQALHDPAQLISLWNRPLAALYLALPSQAGPAGVVLAMALLSTASCAALYQAQRRRRRCQAAVIIPLLALQPFFFATGYCALAEPFAACLLALAYLFHVRRQPVALAICSGLLPLARLELAPLMLFPAIALLRLHRPAALLIMAVPMLLWNVVGAALGGDPLWLYSQTLGADSGVNRYGNTPFAHYFERFPFVIGPVLFYFLITALVHLLRERRAELFVTGPLLLGFMIYVLFSWKLSLGQAYGFLRHLVALSPLFAILAHEGYCRWIDPVPARGQRWSTWAAGLIAFLLMARFYSIRLVDHHALSYEVEYAKLAVCAVLLLAGVGIGNAFQGRRANVRPEPVAARIRRPSLIGAGLALLLAGAYTLASEPPEKTFSDERKAMRMIAEAYREAGFERRPTLVNHIAFFHAADLSPFEPNLRPLTRENLPRLPVDGIVIWENHYSQRLIGNVLIEDVRDHPHYEQIGRMRTPDQKFSAYIFRKTAAATSGPAHGRRPAYPRP